MLAYLWEGRLYAERISPVFGADLDEPAPAPGLAETTRMLARLDAFASPAIRAAAQNYTRLINECVHQAMTLRRAGRAQKAGSPVAHPVGDWKARSAADEALVEAWEPLADLVRGELHGLGQLQPRTTTVGGVRRPGGARQESGGAASMLGPRSTGRWRSRSPDRASTSRQ